MPSLSVSTISRYRHSRNLADIIYLQCICWVFTMYEAITLNSEILVDWVLHRCVFIAANIWLVQGKVTRTLPGSILSEGIKWEQWTGPWARRRLCLDQTVRAFRAHILTQKMNTGTLSLTQLDSHESKCLQRIKKNFRRHIIQIFSSIDR